MECYGGCCLNPDEREARRINKIVDKKLREEKQLNESEYKLLILGTGESGKSTFLRQIKLIYGKGYDINEKLSYINGIRSNLITCILSVIEAAKEYGISLQERAMQNSIANITETSTDLDIISDIVKESIEYICGSILLKEILLNCCKYKLPDSAEYFLKKANRERILSMDYTPELEDIIRIRIPTTGIIQFNFQIKGVNFRFEICFSFRMVDVGGQRSERRKWIHCFDNVTSIIFMVGLSEYDQTLIEDPTQNRMVESLALFKAIISHPAFVKMSIILLLNKIDLFEKKIKVSPLEKIFPEYKGSDNLNNATRFILSKFMAVNPYPDKTIYSHFTCATDTGNILFVFEAVKDTVLQKNLSQLNLA